MAISRASFVVVCGIPRFKELSIPTSRIWCHSEKCPFPFLEARSRSQLFVCLGAIWTPNKGAHVRSKMQCGFGSQFYTDLMTFCGPHLHEHEGMSLLALEGIGL